MLLLCVSEQEEALQEQAELELRKQDQIRTSRQKAAVFLKQTLRRYRMTHTVHTCHNGHIFLPRALIYLCVEECVKKRKREKR